MRAAPKAVNEFQIPGNDDVDPPLATTVGVAMADAGAPVTVSPNPTSAAIAINFRIINRFCVRAIRTMVASNAATVSLASICPSAHTYFAKVTATAAIPPLCVTSSNAQP